MKIGYRGLRLAATLLLACQTRLRVYGVERIPRSGAVLLVANHLGAIDPVAIALRIPRMVRILAKAEILTFPVLGGLARLGAVIPIRRGESDREALRTVVDQLWDGQAALVFPEGTFRRVPEPAAMAAVKPGAAWLALRTGATVVPVGIWGTERVWHPSRGWMLWHRPHVYVVFGEPYLVKPRQGVPTKTAIAESAAEMARRIASLVPAEYRGYYGSGEAGGAPAWDGAVVAHSSARV
jgi:1-acyl-sn-glycerol-3-phosphate acyltransferase